MGAYPGTLTTQGRVEEDLKAHATHATPTPDHCHLRSSNAVIGHYIKRLTVTSGTSRIYSSTITRGRFDT
jgi:hypothetical protein